jgi:hypothetical protein
MPGFSEWTSLDHDVTSLNLFGAVILARTANSGDATIWAQFVIPGNLSYLRLTFPKEVRFMITTSKKLAPEIRETHLPSHCR